MADVSPIASYVNGVISPSEATSNPFVLTLVTSGVHAGSIFVDWCYPAEVSVTSPKVLMVKCKLMFVLVLVLSLVILKVIVETLVEIVVGVDSVVLVRVDIDVDVGIIVLLLVEDVIETVDQSTDTLINNSHIV